MNDCCNSRKAASQEAAPNPICSECGGKGEKVDEITPKSLLTPSARRKYQPGQYYFCATENCPVVYFNDTQSLTFHQNDVEVRVWQKEGAKDPGVFVCYCFAYSAASLRKEAWGGGNRDVFAEIKSHVQAGRCACEVKNPQGRCCLGNVQAVLKGIQRPG